MPVRIVERKQSRRKFFKAQIAIGTSVLCGIKHLISIEIGNHKPLGKFDCTLDCVGYTSLRTVLYDNTVDNDADVVFYVFVKFDFFIESIVCSVNSHTHITRAFELFEFLAVFTLSASDDRSENLEFRTFFSMILSQIWSTV